MLLLKMRIKIDRIFVMTKLLPSGLCFSYTLELLLNTSNSINYVLTSSMELSFTVSTNPE